MCRSCARKSRRHLSPPVQRSHTQTAKRTLCAQTVISLQLHTEPTNGGQRGSRNQPSREVLSPAVRPVVSPRSTAGRATPAAARAAGTVRWPQTSSLPFPISYFSLPFVALSGAGGGSRGRRRGVVVLRARTSDSEVPKVANLQFARTRLAACRRRALLLEARSPARLVSRRGRAPLRVYSPHGPLPKPAG
jgi:hypothetical protein